MAEDFGDKTEPATPKRRQEAWDSGQFARSQDLTTAVLLLSGILALSMTAQSFVGTLADAMKALLGNPFENPQDMMDNSLRIGVPHIVKALAPILLTVASASLLISILQVGLRVTGKPLIPNLAKLNPVQGLGRLFAGQNWFQLGMNIAKMITIAVVAYTRFKAQLGTIISLSSVDFPANFAVAAAIIYDLAWRLAVALLILGILDWMYHKWKFERDIRMSKQEIKDEAKRMEGDQEIKGRRRQLARKMIIQRIHRDVPRADVVVTNPTELAIALKYDPETMSAPRVVAKGAGFLAARIRQIAVQNGVPIVERKPLAQTLYKTVEVGQELPPELYQAVAEILAYVYELSGRGLRRLKQAV
jgi:flagellar biosynthesis protein FlhB